MAVAYHNWPAGVDRLEAAACTLGPAGSAVTLSVFVAADLAAELPRGVFHNIILLTSVRFRYRARESLTNSNQVISAVPIIITIDT